MLREALERPYLQAPIGLHSHDQVPAHAGELLGLDPSRSSSARSTPPSSRCGICGAGHEDFFGIASFAIVANETYRAACGHFLKTEMGLPCTFSFARSAGVEARQRSGAAAVAREDAARDVRKRTMSACIPPRSARARSAFRPSFPALHHPSAYWHAVHGLRRRHLPRAGVAMRSSMRSSTSCRSRPTWIASRRRPRGSLAPMRRRGTTRRTNCSRIPRDGAAAGSASLAQAHSRLGGEDARRAGEEEVTAATGDPLARRVGRAARIEALLLSVLARCCRR